MPDKLVTRTEDADDTRAVGFELGRLLAPGDIVCLYGELGAGKTTLVQGLARGLGVPDDYITSPTFSLVNEYRGAVAFYHIDLYRLSSSEEVEDIGFPEYLADGVAAVEWPERAGGALPDKRLELRLSATGDNTRVITLSSLGKRFKGLLEELCQSSRWSRP